MDTVTRHYDVEVELPGDEGPTYQDLRVGADVSAKDGELVSFELMEWALQDAPWQSIDTLPAVWAGQVREKALARAMDPEELESVEKDVEEALAEWGQ